MKGNLLKAAIVSKGWTQTEFVRRMRDKGSTLSQSGLSMRLNGKVEFKQSEIDCISDVLNLSPNQIKDIFFSQLVS